MKIVQDLMAERREKEQSLIKKGIKIGVGIVGIIFAIIIGSLFCDRVDPGNEGIKEILIGNNKGVQKVPLKPGIVWHNPLYSKIYQYPTFVQTVDYEPFTVNAKDGGSFVVDPTISLKIVDGKTPEVFLKYRNPDIEDIINTTLLNYVKNAFRMQLNKYTTDELVSKREEFETAIEKRLSEELLKENFQLEQLTSGLQYPQSLVNSIEEKNASIQKSLKIQNEIAAVKAQAEKEIAAAEGQAKALRIKAEAEAEYNRKVSESLSTLIIQQNLIEKWDGRLPTVNGGSGTILDASKLIK